MKIKTVLIFLAIAFKCNSLMAEESSKVSIPKHLSQKHLSQTDLNQSDLEDPVLRKLRYKPMTVDDSHFHGYIRMHQVIDGKSNGFDRETGSTLGLSLGYGHEIVEGLKVGAEFYGVGDTGLTNTDGKTVAYGIFMNDSRDPNELDAGYAWGIHIKYEAEKFKAILSRSQFESPLTQIQITQVPNLYEYARIDTKLLDGKISFSFINKISYGSRASADFGLIGERTATAGAAISPFRNPRGHLRRGTYYNISDTLRNNNSKGIFIAGYENKIDKINFRIWNFLVDDVANNLYADAIYTLSFSKERSIKLSSQLWNQNVHNDFYEKNYGGTMLGVEVVAKWGKAIVKMAYSSKDEGALLNAWGANPGYTSSVFSRNEYRSDVNAYKVTLAYKPLHNLKLMISYADYGQSSMNFTVRKAGETPFVVNPTSDATERDIAIVYTPRKDIKIRLFNGNRISEFHDPKNTKLNRTQNHTRLILNFEF